MLTSSSEVQSPQLSLYSSESSYSFQTTAGFDVKPPLYRDSSSFSYVTVRKPKPGTLESMTPPSLTTSVTWSTHLGPGREIPAIVGSQVGDSRVTQSSTSSGNCYDQNPQKINITAPSNQTPQSYLMYHHGHHLPEAHQPLTLVDVAETQVILLEYMNR